MDGTHVAKDWHQVEPGRGPTTRRSSDRSYGLALGQVLQAALGPTELRVRRCRGRKVGDP